MLSQKIHVVTNGEIILRVEFPQIASIAIAEPAVDVHEINEILINFIFRKKFGRKITLCKCRIAEIQLLSMFP